jgi:hypothetical protein
MAALEDGRHLFVSIRYEFDGQMACEVFLTRIVGRTKLRTRKPVFSGILLEQPGYTKQGSLGFLLNW